MYWIPFPIMLLFCLLTGRLNVKQEEIDEMLKEASGPINFTVFLTMFGEKLKGRFLQHGCEHVTCWKVNSWSVNQRVWWRFVSLQVPIQRKPSSTPSKCLILKGRESWRRNSKLFLKCIFIKKVNRQFWVYFDLKYDWFHWTVSLQCHWDVDHTGGQIHCRGGEAFLTCTLQVDADDWQLPWIQWQHHILSCHFQMEQMFSAFPPDAAGNLDYRNLVHIITHGEEKDQE